MENRITISICDEEYTFVAEEAPSYMQKVGSYVNDKMSELLDAAKVGRTDAAVLTAVNITDELFKEREAGDALNYRQKTVLPGAVDYAVNGHEGLIFLFYVCIAAVAVIFNTCVRTIDPRGIGGHIICGLQETYQRPCAVRDEHISVDISPV